MSSLQIAEITNKRHDAVLRDIRSLLEQGVQAHNFVESHYEQTLPTGGKKQVPCYQLTKKGCLILASGYNAVLREKIIDRWEELESGAAVPANPQLQFVQTQVYLAEAISHNLRLSEASKLGLYQSIAEPYRLAIPQYVPSKGVLKSATDLLREIGASMTAAKFNQLLESKGYVETISRQSAGGKIRKFKNITDKGMSFGENEVNPKNQKETQPHWYADRFQELYSIVTA